MLIRTGGVLLTSSTYRPARDDANYPETHRTASTTKNDLAQNVSSAEVEKLCASLYDDRPSGPFLCQTTHSHGNPQHKDRVTAETQPMREATLEKPAIL